MSNNMINDQRSTINVINDQRDQRSTINDQRDQRSTINDQRSTMNVTDTSEATWLTSQVVNATISMTSASSSFLLAAFAFSSMNEPKQQNKIIFLLNLT